MFGIAAKQVNLKNGLDSTKSEIHVRVRPYRHSDARQVKDLFKTAMGTGEGSPLHIAVRAQFTRPIAFAIYATLLLALILSVSSPKMPSMPFFAMALIFLACIPAWIIMSTLVSAFRSFIDGAVTGDLDNVATVYGMISSDKKDSDKLSPSGKNAFWVAEAYADGICSEIVGCVGIDVNTSPDQTTAELRRLAVSSTLRRKGVARLLVETAISHARAHNMASIFLRTSSYSAGIIGMYQKFGWVITDKWVWYHNLYIHAFSLDLKN